MQNLPTSFWSQLWARFGQQSPRFYELIRTNSLYFTLLAIAFPFIVTDFLPGIGVVVPLWLTYANTKVVGLCALLAGLGAGSAAVASTTIQTPSTPILESTEHTKTDVDSLAEQVAELRNQIREMNNKNG